MDTLLRFGTWLICLGVAAPAYAQTYDERQVLADSTNCRVVVAQAEIDGTMQPIAGRACLQPDGTWQMVEGTEGGAPSYPVAAWPYPDTWWWGPPVFIGTGVIFIHHFHHFHHFDRFRQPGHDHFRPFGDGFHHAPFPSGGMRGFDGGMHRR